MPQHRDFDLFNFSPVPMWAYDNRNLQILAANDAAQKHYGYTLEEFLQSSAWILVPEEDVNTMMEEVGYKIKQGLLNKATIRHIKKDRTIIYVDIESRPLPSWGEHTRIVSAVDVTTTKRLNDLESLDRKVLEMSSTTGISLEEVLCYYVQEIDLLFPEMICTILQAKNGRLYHCASLSLPAYYTDLLNGLEIGANSGSCGTAAFFKERVIVQDISTDPRWESCRKEALALNLHACWSEPIINSAGEVMATFAVYYNEAKTPNEDELKIVERASSLLKVILENRQYAEALKETTLLMLQGQELAHFGNWSWDIQNDIVTWSDSLFAIYGLNKQDFKATFESYQELLHPDDREMVYDKIQEVLHTHMDTEFEERIIRPDGEVRYLKSWGKLKCENGIPVKMIGACLDITESKKIEEKQEQAEKALKLSNERYAYVNKVTNDAIYDWDILIDHIEWGEAFSRVFGYPTGEKEFSLKRWEALIHREDIQPVSESLYIALKDSNVTRWSAEYRLLKSDGDYAFVIDKGYILRNEKGTATRMIGALRDVTQRMEHELKIKEHLDRYNAVSKATSDVIWDYNLLTGAVIWNDGINEVFGYDIVEESYQWWYEHVHPDDVKKATDIVAVSIKEKRTRWSSEYRFKCADGNYKFVLDRGFLIFDETGLAIRMIGAMEDITERINYIHTIEQHNVKLQDIGWAQTHLVRAPLARILGLIGLLKEDRRVSEEDNQLLSYLDISAKELDTVVKSIIDKSLYNK